MRNLIGGHGNPLASLGALGLEVRTNGLVPLVRVRVRVRVGVRG